jgi:hypothetical protein
MAAAVNPDLITQWCNNPKVWKAAGGHRFGGWSQEISIQR